MMLYLGVLLFFMFYSMKEPFVVHQNKSLSKFTSNMQSYCSFPYKYYYRKIRRYLNKS